MPTGQGAKHIVIVSSVGIGTDKIFERHNDLYSFIYLSFTLVNNFRYTLLPNNHLKGLRNNLCYTMN